MEYQIFSTYPLSVVVKDKEGNKSSGVAQIPKRVDDILRDLYKKSHECKTDENLYILGNSGSLDMFGKIYKVLHRNKLILSSEISVKTIMGKIDSYDIVELKAMVDVNKLCDLTEETLLSRKESFQSEPKAS